MYHTLNVGSPVISQALPIKINVLALANANPTQMAIEGIHPVPPAAFPAAKVSNPAPATLFARLNTDDAKDAFPPFIFRSPFLMAPPDMLKNLELSRSAALEESPRYFGRKGFVSDEEGELILEATNFFWKLHRRISCKVSIVLAINLISPVKVKLREKKKPKCVDILKAIVVQTVSITRVKEAEFSSYVRKFVADTVKLNRNQPLIDCPLSTTITGWQIRNKMPNSLLAQS